MKIGPQLFPQQSRSRKPAARPPGADNRPPDGPKPFGYAKALALVGGMAGIATGVAMAALGPATGALAGSGLAVAGGVAGACLGGVVGFTLGERLLPNKDIWTVLVCVTTASLGIAAGGALGGAGGLALGTTMGAAGGALGVSAAALGAGSVGAAVGAVAGQVWSVYGPKAA